MNSVLKFFNYNWIKIIKDNIKNKNIKTIDKKEKKETINLVFKKEICAIIFVVLNFLITFTSTIEIYKMQYRNFVLFHVIKDTFFTTILWFVLLTILPLITCIMLKKKIKSNKYLLISIVYLLSNLFNILMMIYFITTFINNILIGLLGILNIILTVIINMNIIVKLKENYLK